MQVFAICHETEWMDFYISFDSWRAHCLFYLLSILYSLIGLGLALWLGLVLALTLVLHDKTPL